VKVATLTASVLAAGPLAALTPAGSPAQAARAMSAGSVSVKDEGHLRLIRSSGSVLYDEGPAHGTFPGTVKLRFLYDGNPNVSAQITIRGHSGSIQARGSGRLSSPNSASPSFKGTLTISGGSGRYAGAHGSGTLYGVFYRRSYAITVQTEGTLHY
jgi:hypothetical protein